MSTFEELSLGPAPSEEECEQVGPHYDVGRARAECRAYRDQLVRERGAPPNGVLFVVRSCPHDLGAYLDLVVAFDAGNQVQVDYAWECEALSPGRWDAEARAALGLAPLETPLPAVPADGKDHCPACGRLCGEYEGDEMDERCIDTFHAAANRAPELVRVLRELLLACLVAREVEDDDDGPVRTGLLGRVQHLLGELPGGLP